jgi:hypothetical protein
MRSITHTFIQSFNYPFMKVEFMDKPVASDDQRVYTELEPPPTYINIK